MDSRYPSPQARGLQQTLKQQGTKKGKELAKEMELHLRTPDHEDGLPRRLVGSGQDPSILISRFLYAEATRQGYKMFSPYTAFELQVSLWRRVAYYSSQYYTRSHARQTTTIAASTRYSSRHNSCEILSMQ